MHLKAYAVDGRWLRTGSTNFSWSGETRQDNDIIVIDSPQAAAQFHPPFRKALGAARQPGGRADEQGSRRSPCSAPAPGARRWPIWRRSRIARSGFGRMIPPHVEAMRADPAQRASPARRRLCAEVEPVADIACVSAARSCAGGRPRPELSRDGEAHARPFAPQIGGGQLRQGHRAGHRPLHARGARARSCPASPPPRCPARVSPPIWRAACRPR